MNGRIGITVGDPAGIGPELLSRTLALPIFRDVPVAVYAPPNLFPSWKTSERFDVSDTIVVVPVDAKKENRAQTVLASIDLATKHILDGKLRALVTCPIDKSVVRTLRPDFAGHTEYLAELTGVERTVMLLDNSEIRVAFVTQHIALRDVARTITPELFESVLRITAESLAQRFEITHPRIAVAGINPHAGEITSTPEEETVLRPVIAKLNAEGWNIEGPFAGDSLFGIARCGKWDVLISPYHDQGSVAVKYSGLHNVVNITLGLPFLRVSPGHGVAYDLVGKGTADTRSLERALRLAATGRLND